MIARLVWLAASVVFTVYLIAAARHPALVVISILCDIAMVMDVREAMRNESQ